MNDAIHILLMILLIPAAFAAIFVVLGLLAEGCAMFQFWLQERDRMRRNARIGSLGLPYRRSKR